MIDRLADLSYAVFSIAPSLKWHRQRGRLGKTQGLFPVADFPDLNYGIAVQ